MDTSALDLALSIADVGLKAVALAGGLWALYKVREYRELKQRIQLEISARTFKLDAPEQVSSYTWDREGQRVATPLQPHTHAVEIALTFTNKGLVRSRLYNIQVGINTMRPSDQARFDQEDGHLRLARVFTSGNIVPLFAVEGKPAEKTSFYYIEPGVEQTITYLALIPAPRELLQVHARFNFEQKRLFPRQVREQGGLYPHTASRTYQVDAQGQVVDGSG